MSSRTNTGSTSLTKAVGSKKKFKRLHIPETLNEAAWADLIEHAKATRDSPLGKALQTAKLSSSLTFLPTWHPAYLFKDMPRSARSFLLHIEKAVNIALGQTETPLPKVLIDPPAREARKIFKRWSTDGWAVDVETPSLTEYRLLSVAVCGDPKLAMVWSCLKGVPKALREALETPVRKVVQNGDFDIGVFLACGVKVDPETFWDTMIEGGMLHPDEPVNLSFLASNACDTHAWKFRREGDLLQYNALDAWVTWMIYLDNQRSYEDE